MIDTACFHELGNVLFGGFSGMLRLAAAVRSSFRENFGGRASKNSCCYVGWYGTGVSADKVL
jgi:hypothetical protein